MKNKLIVLKIHVFLITFAYVVFCPFSAGFPLDFSILTTFRPEEGTQGKLFAVYGAESANEILSLKIGKNTEFIYRDVNGVPEDPIPLGVDLSDGR